jgi:Na+-translocating ferredoxin:NAD+ oxidoreductase subunit C
LPRHERRSGELLIRQTAFAPLLNLPLRQHAGRAAVAAVRAGDEVARGQLLAARAEHELALPLHSPATGRVVSIVEQPDSRGGTVTVICLAPFPGDTQEYPVGRGWDPGSSSAASLCDAIRAAGIVGQGGEGRPTYAGLRTAAAGGVATLVLNGIEEEPAFSRVPAILRAHRDDVLMGVRYLVKATGAARVVLAVEQHDAEAAASLVAAAAPGCRSGCACCPRAIRRARRCFCCEFWRTDRPLLTAAPGMPSA